MNKIVSPLVKLALISVFSSSAISQTCNDSIGRTAYDARYEILLGAYEEVRDLATGLTWQRCALGYEFDDQSESVDLSSHSCDSPSENSDDSDITFVQVSFTWNDAIEAADEEGGDWRLPNFKELSSLIELACFSPALNSTAFPDALTSSHWSSTPDANDEFEAWTLGFSVGDDSTASKATYLPIRLVRDSD